MTNDGQITLAPHGLGKCDRLTQEWLGAILRPPYSFQKLPIGRNDPILLLGLGHALRVGNV